MTTIAELVAEQGANAYTLVENSMNDWTSYLNSIQSFNEGLGNFGRYWTTDFTNVRANQPSAAGANSAGASADASFSALQSSVAATNYSFAVADPLLDVLAVVPTISLADIPEYTGVEPTLNLPTAPNSSLPAAPGAAPAFNAPDIPTAPSITLPAVPSFTEVTPPEAPTLETLSFDGVLPDDELLLPDLQFQFDEQAYASVLLDKTTQKLIVDMDGGYGIEPGDEQQLWDRARERELRNVEGAVREARRQRAARGFLLHDGVRLANEAAARREGMEKIASFSREVALKRADMYVENRRFTIQEARALEQMNINYWVTVADRALRAAVANVELGVQLYNLAVSRFQARLEAFKTSAAVYETRIRAQLNQLEQYKSRIEAANLTLDQQATYARIYEAQVRGAQAVLNIYSTEMEGARTAAEIERLKLDGFRASVDAYGSQVGARASEFQMYEAQIRGETAKLDAYRTSISAYGTRVDAAKTRIAAQEIAVNSAINTNKLKLDKYAADMDKYRATVAAESERLQLLLGRDKTLAALAESRARTAVDVAKTGIDVSKATMDSELDIQKVFVTAAQSKADELLRLYELKGRLMDYTVDSLSERTRALANLNSSLAVGIGEDAA